MSVKVGEYDRPEKISVDDLIFRATPISEAFVSDFNERPNDVFRDNPDIVGKSVRATAFCRSDSGQILLPTFVTMEVTVRHQGRGQEPLSLEQLQHIITCLARDLIGPTEPPSPPGSP